MSDEDQKLMEQISLLAGKYLPADTMRCDAMRCDAMRCVVAPRSRNTCDLRPFPISLVLNNPNATNNSNHVAGSTSDDTASSWVTRSDRHLQLINSNVFHEQTEARNKAMQQTRLQKQQQKEHRERAQLMNHLKHTANPSTVSANPASAPTYEISVEGIRFRVANNGSKLVKLPGALPSSHHYTRLCSPSSGDPNNPKATPKMALVGGVKFHRSKNGNMYRQAIVKAHRQSATVKKTNVTCRNFSNTGAPVCQSFGFYGYCEKGISCPDRHVFECPDFSNTGVCKTKGCKLPHRERASVLRKANAALAQNASGDDEDDLSSDDGNNSVSSNDVDSDEVEEFIGEEDPMDFEQDFISFN
ncbi:hypothetical protein J7T55_010751 [Diaporthe amygdali]|uniref:uncharacterized protein n=1 Tax=Phomopsis amygdali TaxID=1214568 RepID=UPI0022FE0BBB|nr:uncharacterized protein J7T55_010751 [Diaporthe amygdali]KAJ0114362.1 hypothetical protein J7T55_010751 [Diaporthe amygdali]